MLRGLSLLIMFLFLHAISNAQQAAPTCTAAAISEIRWILGTWKCDMGGRMYQEKWTQDAQGVITGEGHFIVADSLKPAESLAIMPIGNKLVYIASPVGQEPALFRFVEATGSTFLAVNSEHDFPQQIRYSVVHENELKAVVDGILKGDKKSFTYVFTRMK